MNMDFLSQEVAAGAEETLAAVSELADEVISEEDMGELVTGTIVSEMPYLTSEVDPTAPAAAPVVTAGVDLLTIDLSAHPVPVDFRSYGVDLSYNDGTDWSSFWRTSASVINFPTLSYATTYMFRFSIRTMDEVDGGVSPSSANVSPIEPPMQTSAEDEFDAAATINSATYSSLDGGLPEVWVRAPVSRQILIFNAATISAGVTADTARQSYEIKHVTGDGSDTAGAEGVTHAPADTYAAVVGVTSRVKSTDVNRITLGTAGNWYRIRAQYQRDNNSGTGTAATFRGRQIVVFPL